MSYYLTRAVVNERGKTVPQGTYLYPRDHRKNTPNKQFVVYRVEGRNGPTQHTMFVPPDAIRSIPEEEE